MHRIYHGCMFKNADGRNNIIEPAEKSLAPTYKCFWEDPRTLNIIEEKQDIVQKTSQL